MPVHGPSGPERHSALRFLWMSPRGVVPTSETPGALLHPAQEHFLPVIFFFGIFFSPSFYQSQMLKKCLGPVVWRVTAGGTEIMCPCRPHSPTTDTLGGKWCIPPRSHWSRSTPSQPEPLHWRQDWGRVWGCLWSLTPPWTNRKLGATQQNVFPQYSNSVIDLGTKTSPPFMKHS